MGLGSTLGSILGSAGGFFVGGPSGAAVGGSIGGSIGGSFDSNEDSGGGSSGGGQVGVIDERLASQRAVQDQIANILLNGGAPYDGQRIAGLGANEQNIQGFLGRALTTAEPGIQRLLSGQFPEQFFNQAIADPARRDFGNITVPLLNENAELTGNRFADRSAIAKGQAAGDLESAILSERGKLGLNTLRDPINTLSTLSGTLGNLQNVAQVPRTVEQADLDFQFNEFLRTNPDSGGLLQAMLQFSGKGIATPQALVQQGSGPLTQALLSGNAGQVGGGGGFNSGDVISQTLASLGGGNSGSSDSTSLLLSQLASSLFS